MLLLCQYIFIIQPGTILTYQCEEGYKLPEDGLEQNVTCELNEDKLSGVWTAHSNCTGTENNNNEKGNIKKPVISFFFHWTATTNKAPEIFIYLNIS